MNRFLSKVRRFHADERGVAESLQVVVLIAVAALIVIVLYKFIGTGNDQSENTLLSFFRMGVEKVLSLGTDLFSKASNLVFGS